MHSIRGSSARERVELLDFSAGCRGGGERRGWPTGTRGSFHRQPPPGRSRTNAAQRARRSACRSRSTARAGGGWTVDGSCGRSSRGPSAAGYRLSTGWTLRRQSDAPPALRGHPEGLAADQAIEGDKAGTDRDEWRRHPAGWHAAFVGLVVLTAGLTSTTSDLDARGRAAAVGLVAVLAGWYA